MKPLINIFFVGAQKAGTTSVYDWIGQHPNVDAPSEIKDHHFYSDDRIYQKGVKYLEGFYSSTSTLKVHGAVNYLYFAERVAPLLFDYNPDAKLVICLREPKSRAISAYKYFLRTLRETRSFDDALQAELRGDLKSYEEQANNTYIGHGQYADQIMVYLRYFKKSQIHCMFFDDIVNPVRQESEMKSLCRFLEVNEDVKFEFSHRNASVVPKFKTISLLLRMPKFSGLFKMILPFKYRRRLGKKIEQWNLSDRPIRAEILVQSVDVLDDVFTDQVDALSNVIGANVREKWHKK